MMSLGTYLLLVGGRVSRLGSLTYKKEQWVERKQQEPWLVQWAWPERAFSQQEV